MKLDGVNRLALLNLAGPRYFERGEDYYLDGRVEGLHGDGETLTATVQGTRPYTVTLRSAPDAADDLEWACDCPLAAEGAFCKRCVAAGLAALSPAATGAAPVAPPIALDQLRERLEALDREALVSLLIDHRAWGRFAVEHMMEKVARRTGAVDEVVEVKRRNLSSSYSFLQIAELYPRRGSRGRGDRVGRAGSRLVPDRVDHRLMDFLADVHAEVGRHEAAAELAWSKFNDRPGLAAYEDLKRRAEPVGDWPRRRGGQAIDLVLDRGRNNRSQFVFTKPHVGRAGGRAMIFWQTARTARRSRPGTRVPTRRAPGPPELTIDVDSNERYGYRFAGRPVERRRRALTVGDYAVVGEDGAVVAVVERKTLENFAGSVVDGSLGFQLTELASVPSAAVVVEERYAALLKVPHVQPGWLCEAVTRLQVRYPMVPIVFADSRKLAEDYTYRFLAAALDHHGPTSIG